MSTSQSTEITEPPVCPNHGYMVMFNTELALLDESGLVVAMASWWRVNDAPTKEYIYALDEASLALVPRLEGDEHLGSWMFNQQVAGRLVNYYGQVVRRHDGVLAIDDCRPGYKYGYRVYDGPVVNDGPRLAPGQVYHLLVDSDDEGHTEPRLTTASDVLSLTGLPEAVLIRDVGDLNGKFWTDPEVIERFGDLSAAIRVSDECAIQRTIDLTTSADSA